LRHFKTVRPDGGYTQQEYDDGLTPDPAAPRLHSYVKTIVRLDVVGTLERVVTSYQYLDGRGAVARSFGPQTTDGYPTVDVEYDSMGRPFRASNPYYTLNGTTDAVNPSGKWTKRTFDKLGRVTQITLPDNNIIQTDYAGDTLTVTDQAGKQRRRSADALGRVERVDEPDATGNLGTIAAPLQATSYVYDVLDNLVKITHGSQRRYFKYDSLSRLTYERQVEQDAPHYHPDTLTGNNYWSRRYVYSADSLMTDSYDARNVRAHFDYDGLNRPTKITYSGETSPTPNVFYTYDQIVGSFFNKGRLTQVETKVGSSVQTSVQYNYNKMGQVAQHTQTVNGTSYTTSYLYNLIGDLTKETYPAGRRAVSYNYDDAARLQSVADGARTYTDGFAYAPHGGLLAETFGNSTVHSLTYNTRLQPIQIKLMSGATVLQRYDYAYGEVDTTTGAVDVTKNTGQVARVEGYIGTQKQWQQRYSYDELGRLSLASEHPGTSTTTVTYRADYAHDRYGNRSQDGGQNYGLAYTQVRATDISATTNRYVSGTGIQYDAAGQITVDPKFRGRRYDYDANGRQRWTAQTDGTDVATAVYDGLGQRVETTASGASRQVVYDAYGQMISEYAGGAWERDYVYRGGEVVATIEASDEVRYVMSDHQGSMRVAMDSSGGILARHDYLPYGEELQAGTGLRTSAQGYGGADQTRQRYAGMEQDNAGLNHTWYRKYESESGRWTTADPYTGSMSVSDPQSLNRYSYVENDPVNRIDPSGLFETAVCGADHNTCGGGWDNGGSGFGGVDWDIGFIKSIGGWGEVPYREFKFLGIRGPGGLFRQDPSRGGRRKKNKREKQKEYDECVARAETRRAEDLQQAETDFQDARAENAVIGGGIGAITGALGGGPGGALAGAALGAAGGYAYARLQYNRDKRKAETSYRRGLEDCDHNFPLTPEGLQEHNREVMESIQSVGDIFEPSKAPFPRGTTPRQH
jgi:RHS repeat-associated protein